MLTLIVGGIGELVADFLLEDEEEKRAFKAGAWGVAGAIGAASVVLCPAEAAETAVTETVATAASPAAEQTVSEAASQVTEQVVREAIVPAAIMVGAQGAAAATDDAKAKAVIDTGASILSGSVESWVGLAKAAGGAAVGAGIGAAADGEDGAIAGMSMGSSVMRGSWVENGTRLVGGGVGAGAGAAMAHEGERGEAAKLGFGVGVSVGGATAQLSVGDAAARRAAVTTLAAEVAAPVVAAAVHEDGAGRSFVETYSAMRGVTASMAAGVDGGIGLYQRATALEPVIDVLDVAAVGADVGSGVGGLATYLVEREEEEEERRQEGGGGGSSAAERADQRRRAVESGADLVREVTRFHRRERA